MAVSCTDEDLPMDPADRMRFASAEEFYRTVFDHSLDASFLGAADGRIFAANAAACALFGRTEREICALGRPGLVDLTSAQLGTFLDTRASTGMARAELTFVRGDGTRFLAEVSSAMLTDDPVHGRLVVTVRDLTERRAAERALTESQVVLDAIVNSTRDFIFSVDPETFGLQWFNRAFRNYQLHERGKRLEIGMRAEELFEEASYVQYWRSLFQRALREGYCTVEYETITHSMTLRFYLTVLKRDGVVFGISVFGRDITQLKHDEHDLRISAAAFDRSGEAMFITDPGGTIVKVNDAFTKLTGYPKEEAVGQSAMLLKSDRQDRAFYESSWRQVRDEKHWRGELWNRKKSGELFQASLSVNAVTDIGGVVTGYVAGLQDLTAHRRQEAVKQALGNYDELTGALTRRALMDRIRQAQWEVMGHRRHGALLVVDLDGFRSLNEQGGYGAGDLYLSEIAVRLKSRVFAGGTVARLSIDAFGIVLVELNADAAAAAVQAETVAHALQEVVRRPFNLRGLEYQGTACVGITLFSDGDVSAEALLQRADAEMFRAKARGREQVSIFGAA
ncbi:MAG: PAS domain S-box protein [Gemmatimonadaceae bacterium]